MKKKILAITGIRSEYDIIKQVIKELKKKNSVKVIVSGAHLTKIHNFSEILRTTFNIPSKFFILMGALTLYFKT